MIVRKTPAEIDAMARAGEIHVRTMNLLAGKIRAGVTTGELDAAAEKFIRSQGATPAFKGYRGFPGSICASPNHMVVHGIPGKFKLRKGDILSVDIGVVKDGWVADGARTFPVGDVSPVAAKLLQVTEESLFCAVEQCVVGNRLGDVSHAVQTHVEENGFSVVRSLVGHGIGRSMHEEPQIPNYGPPGKGVVLEEGMVLAIEPMVTAGRHMVRMGDDGWAIYSQDGSLAAHFEFTVAITAAGPRILTPWHEAGGAGRGLSALSRRTPAPARRGPSTRPRRWRRARPPAPARVSRRRASARRIRRVPSQIATSSAERREHRRDRGLAAVALAALVAVLARARPRRRRPSPAASQRRAGTPGRAASPSRPGPSPRGCRPSVPGYAIHGGRVLGDPHDSRPHARAAAVGLVVRVGPGAVAQPGPEVRGVRPAREEHDGMAARRADVGRPARLGAGVLGVDPADEPAVAQRGTGPSPSRPRGARSAARRGRAGCPRTASSTAATARCGARRPPAAPGLARRRAPGRRTRAPT